MAKEEVDDLDAVRKIVEALGGFEPNDQERILRWAREKVGLATQQHPVGTRQAPATGEPTETTARGPTPRSLDVKSFVEGKNPSSDTQFAATVAYYYRFEGPEHLRKDSVTADDLQEACRLVGRPRLKRPDQTLIDARKQGFLDREDRGSYTINTVGENLVAMALPAEGGPIVRARRRARPGRMRAAKTSDGANKSTRPKQRR